MGGTIESISMEAVGPDHVFVERDMVRNKYWLGLSIYLIDRGLLGGL